MENTPLYDALRAFAAARPLRMHMPGHKGRPLPAPELAGLSALDFTELPPTGDLFSGGDAIEAAEELWAKAFRMAHCLFLTGGATQGVQAALALACRPGDAVLLDCHTPHAYRSRQGWQALWLHFDGPGAAGYYRWITRGGSPVLHPADFAGLCGALGRIYRLFEAGLVPGEGLLAREVTAALGCLLDPGPGAAPDPLDQVLYAITANLDKEMTVRELADLAHFSEYHFIRLFRARVGMTPRQYLIAARMERARYLLKATNLPLQAISEQVGYASDNVFCTQFKRRYGLTPTEFRLG